ncbi:MAG: branched-chain amino acid ABC transporter permease [Clostridia bacterium]|nr:branched-chain amino acid ABC transporter permease [Clostridia bacterium]
MRHSKSFYIKNYLNYAIILVVLIVFTVLSLTGSAKLSTLLLLEKIAISVILSVSLCMVVGFLGELSLGHAGFMCAGAFLGGKASALLEPVLGNGILTLVISMLVGGFIAALFGVIIGLPALRLRGDYLAIVTLAFGEIIRSLVMNAPTSWFGGTLGLPTPKFNSKYLFIVAFLMVLACLAVTQNLIRSKHGRAIASIRDNEIAARASGVDVTKYKLFVFTVSAFFAGIAGVLYSYTQTRVQSVNFDYNYSIEILVMVVLGGLGSINGSIIAAVLITFLDVELQTLLPGDLAVLQDLFYALILIVIVIYKNAPGLKSFRERYNLRKLLIGRFAAAADAQSSTDSVSGKEEE